MPTYNLQQLQLESSNKTWEDYYNFRVKYDEKNNDFFSYNNWEQLKKNCKIWFAEGIGIYLIYNDETLIGDFSFDVKFKSNNKKRYVNFIYRFNLTILENEQILNLVLKAFIQYDTAAKYLVITSVNGENDFVEQKLAAKIADCREVFSLEMKGVNEVLMEEWLAGFKLPNEEFTVQFYKDIPDELLQNYSDVFIQFIEEMPSNTRLHEVNLGAKEIKKRQELNKQTTNTSYRYLVFNKGGIIIAKTNVFLNTDNPKSAYQYMTGVLKKHRRKGIAKWMKAAMFKRLKNEFPSLQIIETEVHVQNAPSRNLNLKMGYKKIRVVKEYMISRKNIEAYLN